MSDPSPDDKPPDPAGHPRAEADPLESAAKLSELLARPLDPLVKPGAKASEQPASDPVESAADPVASAAVILDEAAKSVTARPPAPAATEVAAAGEAGGQTGDPASPVPPAADAATKPDGPTAAPPDARPDTPAATARPPDPPPAPRASVATAPEPSEPVAPAPTAKVPAPAETVPPTPPAKAAEPDTAPLDPATERHIAKIRRLMLFSSLGTMLAIAGVLTVIGYRLFKGDGRPVPAPPPAASAPIEATLTLPQGARIIHTAVAEDRLVLTIDIGGTIEIRTYDVTTLKPAGRLNFSVVP